MLDAARQGYIYQDILGAYFVAQELAFGRVNTKFHFDQKKTPEGVPDKFDDLTIYNDESTIFIQVKYSNNENRHSLKKEDFSSQNNYDLALYDLFKTWKALHKPGCSWRICLAWDEPLFDDPINDVLFQLPNSTCFLPGTKCYQFNCDVLWPKDGLVLSSWKALRRESKFIDRNDFKFFLEYLIIEVNCPKSTILLDNTQYLEKLLASTIEKIGIGIYPNDHLTVRQVAESLCTITMRGRVTSNSLPISCDEIAKNINIIQNFGGIEQKFSIDKNVLVATPDRINQVVSVLESNKTVILTAEPGAGKSWLIENLQLELCESTQIIKHYCYVALEDPLALKRITVNVLFGSLITQIVKNNTDLGQALPMKYAANLEQLNILLRKLTKKTLLIIDGIDHIWRVYQKNRGGLTEDETEIIKALTQLDCSNPNLMLLIISQPIDQLAKLTTFYHCNLYKLPVSFVERLLEKQELINIEVKGVSLAQKIHDKSNGNALYCKYLVDHALINRTKDSFQWIDSLPAYNFNLTDYYQYLYDQIQDVTVVPYALCGADFSLTEEELKEITHLGEMVSGQLTSLKPILKYIPALGYSIYHESFKRFVIDTITKKGASINHLIYCPLIFWLETLPFFDSSKAFGNLLKLYFEIDSYCKIAQTISVDFIEESLFHAQPFNYIKQNHLLQKEVLKSVNDFSLIIIIAEQAKIIYQIEHNIADNTLVKYLKSVQSILGDEEMYRVLCDGENLLIDKKDAWSFLVDQVYQGKEIVHWSIIPEFSGIPFEMLGMVSVKLLHTKQYERFDDLAKKVYETPKYRKAFDVILNEVEWFCLFNGDCWVKKTPYYQSILSSFTSSVLNLDQAVQNIISSKMLIHSDNWEPLLRDIVYLAKKANPEEIEKAIHILLEHNWFHDWLIYLIKITVLSQREFSNEEIITAFSFLVRDLSPFNGEPRVCDLYEQFS